MSQEPVNVLVIGVGSHVSQGIVKALAKSSLKTKVTGTCLSPQSEFLYFVDRAVLQPRLEDGAEAFKAWLLALCRVEGIQIIVSGIEPVIKFLATHAVEIKGKTGALAIAAPPDILEIAQCKLATSRWLAAHGFNHPRFATWTTAEAWRDFAAEVGFPIIAKPFQGGGSRGLHVLRSVEDIRLVERPETYIFQQQIGTPETEYTVGCFRSPNTLLTDTIVMRRMLAQGFTYKAEIVEHPAIAGECARIGEALGIFGPCNIQLRLHDGKPCCFEINARFSGTTPIRAHYGFNDVEATIRHFLGGETGRLPKVTSGLAYRYWNEAYLDSAAHAQLTAEGAMNPRDFPSLQTDSFGMK